MSIHSIFFQYLQKNLKLKVIMDKKVLSPLYWMQKLQRNTTRTKWIIASPLFSLQALTLSTASVFKVLFEVVQSYVNKCLYFCDLNILK